MRWNQIGVASSISKENDFDARDTLEFCLEHNLKLAQLYLNDQLAKSSLARSSAAQIAWENGIEIVCHFPVPLNDRSLQNEITMAAIDILSKQQKKRVVVHHDESLSVQESAQIVSALSHIGFSVGVENYYTQYGEDALRENIESYKGLLTYANSAGLDFFSVLDLPRLFLDKIDEKIDGWSATEGLIEHVSTLQCSSILHLIDFISPDQRRETWCPIGNGILPLNQIMSCSENHKVEYSSCIIELENKEHVLQSLNALNAVINCS